MYETIACWPTLAHRQERLVAVKSAVGDRYYLLREFLPWVASLRLLLYFWNPAYSHLQHVEERCENHAVRVSRSPFVVDADILPFLNDLEQPGVFVVEGVIDEMTRHLERHLENSYFELQQSLQDKYVVLVGDSISIPLSLYSLIPVLDYPLPSRKEIQAQVAQFCWRCLDQAQTPENIDGQRDIVQGCIGLPRAEIDRVLNRGLDHAPNGDPAEIADYVLAYKQHKLRGRGITLLPEPDVQVAAGMDLLDETMEQIRILLQPEAEERNLRPPKSVLLWGIPGTGKSLAAKLAARRIGGTLVACDWNGLIDDSLKRSIDNLNYLIRFVSNIGVCVLFFDEFEKAFSGWDSSAEGGIQGKLAGKLLSWMNDHVEPVVMMATINHVQMLPAEMLRRFEIIHFFGMPHLGALYAVFNVHLQRYFSRYDFSESEWRVLLREYRGCTPAEVMKAIKQVAAKRFFQDMQTGSLQPGRLPSVTVQELIAERKHFTPVSLQRDISEQIAGILNRADNAKPVSGPDRSIFAISPQKLMGVDEAALRQERSQDTNQGPRLKRSRPAVEDI